MLTVTYTTNAGQAFTTQVASTSTAATQTAAIQAALDQAATQGGGTVTLSEGTWTLAGTGKAADGCLKVGSQTTLEGAGQGSTILKLADGSSSITGIVRTDSGKTLPDGTFTTVSNAAIKNLTIDGNRANTSGEVDGFYTGPKPGTAQADTNITLDGVEIRNCSRYGFDPHERTIGLTITNSSAHHNSLDGFAIDFCANVIMTNNVAYANDRHGFNIITGSTGVIMTGNDAYGNGGSGIAVQTGDNEIRAWTRDITITGGTLSGNGRAGIEARQVSDLDISGAMISGNVMDGVMLAGVQGGNINALTFGNNGGSGGVRIDNYLQTFKDTDAANDRYIISRAVVIDGVSQADGWLPSGAVQWTYVIGDGDDTITGSNGRDVIAAGSGNDTVKGGSGDDLLYGNDGNDTLDGGAGNDRLLGGAGIDLLVYMGGTDILDGGAGSDTADFTKATMSVRIDMAAAGFEVTTAAMAIADLISIENVRGSGFADTLIGNAYKNRLDGGGGADTMSGGAGDDTLLGGAGNDRLAGGLGADILEGGSGSDQFVFERASGTDTVVDFARKQDKIIVAGAVGFDQLTIAQVGTDAHVRFAGDTLVLQNITASALGAGDFLFL
jgi:Ca2+-binding RTX toxin-like protein